MAEENKENQIEKKEEGKKEEIKLSPIQETAVEMGWNPNWEGSPDEFIDAPEFVRRQSLFNKISSQKTYYDRQLNEVKSTLNQLAQHHQKVKEQEYQRALKTLREAKREAMKEGDTIVALELEDKMDTLTSEHQETIKELKQEQQKQNIPNGPSPEFINWTKENKWYLSDEDMHDFADGTAASFVNRAKINGKDITEQDVFTYVEKQVKKAFPEKFSNPNRNRESNVSTGNINGKAERVTATSKLSTTQEEIAKNFEKNGVMTRDEYIKQLKEIGEI